MPQQVACGYHAAMTLAAETAYLFRHALLREAAYQLQPPRQRHALHTLAVHVMEDVLAPEALPPLAGELVAHVRQSLAESPDDESLCEREARYLTLDLNHARAAYDHPRALAALRDLRTHKRISPADRLARRREFGVLLHNLGRQTEALAELEQAVELARNWPRELVHALQALAQVLRTNRQVARAEQLYAQALDLAAELGDATLRATVQRNLALLLLRTGRTSEAEIALRQAAAVHEQNDPQELASDLGNLGLVLHQSGRLDEAEAAMRRAMALSPDDRMTARLLGNLSNILADRGHSDAARHALQQAGRSFERCGDRMGLALMVTNLGSLHREDGRLDLAEASYRQGAALCADLGETKQQAYCEAALAAIQAQRENWAEAEALLRASIETMRRFQDMHLTGSLLCELAIMLVNQGRPGEAETLLWQALRITRDCGYIRMEASALSELGTMQLARGRLAGGMKLMDESVQVSTPGGAVNTAMWRLRRGVHRLLLGDDAGADKDITFGAGVLGPGLGHYRVTSLLGASVRLACRNAEFGPPIEQLRAARALLDAEADILKRHELGGDRLALRQAGRARELIHELESAAAQRRPALVFRGHLPVTLGVSLRAALLAHADVATPGYLARMKVANPALLDAMRSGTQGMAVPDWQNPDVTPPAGF